MNRWTLHLALKVNTFGLTWCVMEGMLSGAVDNLGRVSESTSEVLNGHEGERTFSMSEGDPLAILKNMSMTWSTATDFLPYVSFLSFLKGISLLNSRFLYHFRQNEYYLFIIFGSESYRSAAELRPAKSHVAEKETFPQQSLNLSWKSPSLMSIPQGVSMRHLKSFSSTLNYPSKLPLLDSPVRQSHPRLSGFPSAVE